MKCTLHNDHFDDSCEECKNEYMLLKGLVKTDNSIFSIDGNPQTQTNVIKYKEFSEEKAKILYQKLFLYYVTRTETESDASKRAKKIIKIQCLKRGISPWDWLK